MNGQWGNIAQRLSKSLDAGAYKVWITPLNGEIGTDGRLQVTAPNRFVANYVMERYGTAIRAAARDEMGRDVALSVTGDAARPRTKAAAAPLAAPADGAPAPAQRPAPRPAPRQAEQLSFALPTARPVVRFRHDFSDFVVGDCNRMAYTAASEVAGNGGKVGTLFLSSGPGLGKTHLTQAIGAALCGASNVAHPRIEYLTAEAFAHAFVQAAQSRDYSRFKDRFHEADVLLLEDVHFLQGKEKFQAELLSAVSDLQENGKRVVLTSSFSPKELSEVDASLVSRFCSGFLVGLEKPDADTRRRMLVGKLAGQGVTVDDEVVAMLAEQLSGDVRQLESCLHSLLLGAKVQGGKPTLDMAREVLAKYEKAFPFVNIGAITSRVCEAFNLTSDQLSSKSRKNEYVLARGTVFYLARKHTDLSLAAIGGTFGRRHSTVLKGIASIEREMERETSVGRQLISLIGRIEARCR